MACQWQTRSRGGLYLESTRAGQLGVLPGEDRLVREVMDHRMASPRTDLLSLVDMAASVMSGTATALLREIRNSQ